MAADPHSPTGDPPSGESPDRLFRDLKSAFRGWNGPGREPGEGEGRWDEGRFRRLALRAFRLQYREVPAYRRYCRARGATPADVEDWREVPPVPTAGFRAAPLVVGGPEAAALEFRTSGTTGRMGRRGSHHVRDPSLYRASLEPTFRAYVLERGGDAPPAGGGPGSGGAPGAGAGPLPPGPPAAGAREAPDMLSLIPPFADDPHSSLSWMVDAVMERFAGERAVHAAAAGGIDWGAARQAVDRARAAGRPLCVLATTLAAAEWAGRLAGAGERRELPAGSVLMDTGGAKGRPGLDRSRVVARLQERLGLPPGRIVNEFGMTELLSQRYSEPASPPTDCLVGPPWLRTRALDPETLEELSEGETGLLCHFDLANAGSVCAVLTEDLGRVREGRLRHLGRAGGSPPRGCSLATAQLLEARGRGAGTPGGVGGTPGHAPGASGGAGDG